MKLDEEIERKVLFETGGVLFLLCNVAPARNYVTVRHSGDNLVTILRVFHALVGGCLVLLVFGGCFFFFFFLICWMVPSSRNAS